MAYLLASVVVTFLVASPLLAQAPNANDAKAGARKAKREATPKPLTREARLALIQRAQIWTPTDVSHMDLRAGPQGPGAFAANEMVVCDYVQEGKLSGSSRKFNCAISPNDVVKVRYAATNGEVQGAVLASRLMWALGFGADREYPVRVTCRGCSADPFAKREKMAGERIFDPATIERKPEGYELKTVDKETGWSWQELIYVDAARGGAPRPQRDALTLLAVLIQHTDSKPQQQRLWCLPGGLTGEGACDRPFLMIHDLGLTFGHGNFSNIKWRSSVNFNEWAAIPVWRDAAQCIAHMSRSYSGTLGDPKISEAGRAFLADLLIQLSDAQLHDLFDVARVETRRMKDDGSDVQTGVAAARWVEAFKRKRDEIATTRCPA